LVLEVLRVLCLDFRYLEDELLPSFLVLLVNQLHLPLVVRNKIFFAFTQSNQILLILQFQVFNLLLALLPDSLNLEQILPLNQSNILRMCLILLARSLPLSVYLPLQHLHLLIKLILRLLLHLHILIDQILLFLAIPLLFE
jgi:hypothetical protein